MGELGGFLKIHRVEPRKRPKTERVEEFFTSLAEFSCLPPKCRR